MSKPKQKKGGTPAPTPPPAPTKGGKQQQQQQQQDRSGKSGDKKSDTGFTFASDHKKSAGPQKELQPGEGGIGRKKLKALYNGVVPSRGPIEIDGIQVKEWQRLPKQLLNEYCQQQKRPKPFYPSARCDQPERFRYRVVLPDPKGKKEKDVTLCPEQDFTTQREAEEHAAMLALYHLTPTLPLERKFPEPYASKWVSLRSATPDVTPTSKFVSQKERQDKQEEHRQKANQRERRAELSAKQWVTVFMSDANRQYIDDILKVLNTSTSTAMDTEREGVPDDTPVDETAITALTQKLIKLGFMEKDAKRGATEALNDATATTSDATLQNALDWLLLHLPEHHLPKKFDPRGKQLEVIHHTHHPVETILGQARMGVPLHVCETAIKQHNGDVTATITTLFQQLYADLMASASTTTVTPEVAQSEREGEGTALESIFGNDYRALSDTSYSVQLGEKQGSLEVHIPPNHLYPYELPILILRHDHLSAQQRLHIILHMAQHAITSGMLGTPFMYELITWTRSEMDNMLTSHETPPYPVSWGTSWQKQHGLSNHQRQLLRDSGNTQMKEKTISKKEPRRRANERKEGQNDTAINQQLYQQYMEKTKQNVEYKKMLESRRQLPAHKARQQIIDALEKNQVLVIHGATGCGKSTQIPQFILEHMVESKRGAVCNIICTQPRRISAVGLAERVAEERAEKCGDMIGYRIRMENRVSNNTRLAYVTTGILLRQLTSDHELDGVSHVIIDEVHERSVEIDFLLIVLRQVIRKRPSLKLILMSATADSDAFCSYFSSCPMLSIPGRTFPVQDFYLTDILESTGYNPSGKYRRGIKQEEMKEIMEGLMKRYPNKKEKTLEIIATLREDKIDLELANTMIWHLIDHHDEGGILVFLPGIYEIGKLCDMIKNEMRERKFSDREIWLVPLHGSLNSQQQQRVFNKTPRGCRKIVVSTNIAETSITVDDIVFVIDSGKMKETQYDAEKKMGALVETWISKANGTQRKGRAGRVREGQCYHLYSEMKWEALADHQIPELHRTPLEHLCLQIKLLGLDRDVGGIFETLQQALQPPSADSVKSAVASLKEMNALTENQSITPLGQHLARLPISNLPIGKLLLYSGMFACVTPIVTIAALMSTKSIFHSPMDKRDEADAARRQFTTSKSDHLSLLRAYEAYTQVRTKGYRAIREFCEENFMSQNTLTEVDGLIRQYTDALIETGFITRDSTSHDTNSNNTQIVTAVLCAGLYPNVIYAQHPEELYMKTLNGAVPIANEPGQIKFRLKSGERVFLHPRSVNFSTVAYESPYLVYLQLMSTAKVYVHDCTMVYPYALLLFGGDVDTDMEQGLITVDSWIKFRAPGRIAVLVRQLRKYLDRLLLNKIDQPHLELTARSSPVIDAILRLITTNGF